jgi:hypothetical protein
MINNPQQTSVTQVLINPSYEYRSKIELFGLPLLHITKGINPLTGKPWVSKGIIAIGEIAIGFLAIGGFALGFIAIGGFGIGAIAFGGLVLGLIAAGGISLGVFAAVGGIAYSLIYAVGALAHAQYVISPFRGDQDVFDILGQLQKVIQRVL